MIFGQDRAISQFAAAWATRSLHHAWLIGGPRGTGKASFALQAATRVLADAAGPASSLPGVETAPDHRIAHLVAADSHPDFRLIERLETPKGGLARNISVDQIRALRKLLAMTPSLSPWRAIVIDSADDLEGPAANALLKMLEEPPANCLFLLVAHAPGRLLPTIRSRCRRLDFAALDDAAMQLALTDQVPTSTRAERDALIAVSGGSVGRALNFAALDMLPIERDARSILRDGDADNSRRAKLAGALAGKAAAERYAVFLDLAPRLIAAEARTLEGPARDRALAAYAAARSTATLAPRLSLDPAATVFQLGTILASIAPDHRS